MKTLTKVGVALSVLLSLGACSQPANEAPQDYYMFTSFHEPANEGLRFLYSADGIHWDSVPGTWLKPELGDSILRDPSIIVDKDSTFHLVWTLSWRGNTGFGYARSKDLVHWSDQRRIPAMDSVPSTVNVWAPEWFYDDVNDCYMVIYSSCAPERKFDLGVEEENGFTLNIKDSDSETGLTGAGGTIAAGTTLDGTVSAWAYKGGDKAAYTAITATDVALKTTAAPTTAAGETVEITFAVAADEDQAAGTYTGGVTVTAVANA